MMHANQRTRRADRMNERATPRLELPHLSDDDDRGARRIARVVRIVLVGGLLIAPVAFAAGFMVHMRRVVYAAGMLEPMHVWQVRGREAGIVDRVLVRTGEHVKAGQEIVRLDSLLLIDALSDLHAQQEVTTLSRRHAAALAPIKLRQEEEHVQQAEAHLTTARAKLQESMVDLGIGANVDSLIGTYTPGSHVLLDRSVADVRAAQAELVIGTASVDDARLGHFDREIDVLKASRLSDQIRTLTERLRRLHLRAPVSGVVLTERLERLHGASVAAGEVLMEIAEPGTWRAMVSVPEVAIAQVRIGDPVKVDVEAFRAEDRALLRGRIARIARDAPQQDQRPRIYNAEVDLDSAGLAAFGIDRLRRGYTVETRIITRSGSVSELLREYFREHFNIARL